MGADMTVAGFVITLTKAELEDKWTKSASLFKKRLVKVKAQVSKIKSFSKEWDDLKIYYDSEYNDQRHKRPTFKRWVQAQIHNAIEQLGNRETACWFVKPNKFLMLSGGLSWGDSPTETYDLFNRVNRIPLGILEKAGLE